MTDPFGSDDNKILARFSSNTKCGGNILKFRIMILPKDRYEEFIDLCMKYFVPQEKTHVGTGILDSTEALIEYRTILSKYFKNESLHKIICCQDTDDDDSEIFGGSVLKLYRKDDPCDDVVEVQTEPMEKCKKIDKEFDFLVPVADLMNKYNVERYYELTWAFVRSDMRHMGILKELVDASFLMCRLNNVPLMGAWCTSVGSQRVAEKIGSELEYEINYNDLGQLLGITFENDPPTIRFMVQRNFKRSNL